MMLANVTLPSLWSHFESIFISDVAIMLELKRSDEVWPTISWPVMTAASSHVAYSSFSRQAEELQTTNLRGCFSGHIRNDHCTGSLRVSLYTRGQRFHLRTSYFKTHFIGNIRNYLVASSQPGLVGIPTKVKQYKIKAYLEESGPSCD